MSKHTPGLWTPVDIDQPRRASKRCQAILAGYSADSIGDRKIIATVDFDVTNCRGVRGDYSHFTEHIEGWANAKLIAAAPELLAALEAFLRAPSIGSSGPGSVTIEVQTFNLNAARAAIAKATNAEAQP